MQKKQEDVSDILISLIDIDFCEKRKKTNMKRFRYYVNKFQYALNGIRYAMREDRSTKLQFFLGLIAVFLSIVLKISALEFVLVSIACTLVIFAEMFNSALEAIADYATRNSLERHILIQIAKDLGAGAVLITSVNAVIVGMGVFLPKILRIFFKFNYNPLKLILFWN